MELEDLVEKILQDIRSGFAKEPNIDEFDVIPTYESRNKSPVIVVGTKMAIIWTEDVKLVWLHVFQNLMSWREREVKVDDQKIIQWSEILLLLNPDLSTVWNIRKQFIQETKISLEEEFRLCRLILTRKPKTSEVFTHRRWMLKKYGLENTPTTSKLIIDELLLTTIAAAKYPNNYCAWNHREWVHDNLSSNNLEILLNDLKWNESFLQQHVSDSSGFQFRQYLVRRISAQLDSSLPGCSGESSERCTFIDLLKNEWLLINELMEDYGCHEALWYHRRFVIWWLNSFHLVDVNIAPVSLDTRQRPISKKTRKDYTNPSSCCLIKLDNEMQYALQWTKKDTQTFADHHKRWLAHVFKLNLP